MVAQLSLGSSTGFAKAAKNLQNRQPQLGGRSDGQGERARPETSGSGPGVAPRSRALCFPAPARVGRNGFPRFLQKNGDQVAPLANPLTLLAEGPQGRIRRAPETGTWIPGLWLFTGLSSPIDVLRVQNPLASSWQPKPGDRKGSRNIGLIVPDISGCALCLPWRTGNLHLGKCRDSEGYGLGDQDGGI